MSSITYINYKENGKVETVDCVRREDFDSAKEYRKEIKHVVAEHRLSGLPVYASQRCRKGWDTETAHYL